MYLAVLGRQPDLSLAELEALFSNVHKINNELATFNNDFVPDINRLGGSIKLAIKLNEKPLEYLQKLDSGKITLGVSDYSKHASRKSASLEALKLKKILVRHGRSVRVIENKDATLATATSLHNGLSGKNDRKIEFIKFNDDWYKVIGIQDIDAYARRDQARPARDAKVGMLPPKLAQILINFCGPLPQGSTILDPFCGTGVVLQEALLMGYRAYGTDISDRMVDYTEKNLKWLQNPENLLSKGVRNLARRGLAPAARGDGPAGRAPRKNGFLDSAQPENALFQVAPGDATSFTWSEPIDAVACEGYLGRPMSTVPPDIKLKTEKQECGTIILGFLKNLAPQIKPGTPVVIACPAWLREDGTYSRLEIFSEKRIDRSRSLSEEKQSFSSEATTSGQLFSEKKVDEIEKMGYNVNNKSREGLIYHRDGQIVARDIIILRKN